MTPGARIKTAGEILEALSTSREPADRYLRSWGSKNRYAGSKDRRFLKAVVFDVLRHRASYAEAMGSDDPRGLALAAVRWGQEFSLEEVAKACTGARHDAPKLSDAERTALSPGAAPDVLEWPTWGLEELGKGRSEEETAKLARALNTMAPLDLRVNLSKAKRDDVLGALEAVGFAAKPSLFSPRGIRISRGEGEMESKNIRALPLFSDGRIEIQDEGSQLVALLAGAKPGMQVIELCAGGGGKTLVLAEALEKSGQVFACDTDPARLRNGQERVKRAGISNVQPLQITPWEAEAGDDPELEDHAGKADLVYLDVPCSGSGAWRRQPDGKWRMAQEDLDALNATQSAILKRGARLVKPGGTLVYVTCSVFARENADQINTFLEQAGDFEAQDIAKLWESNIAAPFPAILESAVEPGLVAGSYLQLSPVISGTDGFFTAVLKRKT